MAMVHTTPIFRMFDIAKAREFYLDYLGFEVVFEHRFGENFPLYMGMVRDGCRIHLSEHHGDCSPGAGVRIAVTDVEALHDEISRKDYRYAKPGLSEAPWGGLEFSVADPFSNRITFFQETPQE